MWPMALELSFLDAELIETKQQMTATKVTSQWGSMNEIAPKFFECNGQKVGPSGGGGGGGPQNFFIFMQFSEQLIKH